MGRRFICNNVYLISFSRSELYLFKEQSYPVYYSPFKGYELQKLSVNFFDCSFFEVRITPNRTILPRGSSQVQGLPQ